MKERRGGRGEKTNIKDDRGRTKGGNQTRGQDERRDGKTGEEERSEGGGKVKR